MATKRTYGDRCGVARALDVVGERWALLIIRELLLGPKRFTDLRAGLTNLGPDVLSQRLRELEQAGAIRRRTLPAPASSRVYELTDRGRELEPVILALGRWGSRAPVPSAEAPLGVDSTVIALQTLFDPAAAGGIDASYALCLGADPFALRVSARRLDVRRGGSAAPDATITTDPDTLAAVLWHGRPLAEARRAGDIGIEGSIRAATRFLKLFPAPQPGAAA